MVECRPDQRDGRPSIGGRSLPDGEQRTSAGGAGKRPSNVVDAAWTARASGAPVFFAWSPDGHLRWATGHGHAGVRVGALGYAGELTKYSEEFRDSLLDNRYSTASDEAASAASRDEVLLVRLTDLMEHILRVLAHARRLEDSIESAVQIHFSAVAHRTNRTMRALTIITALFMPLTLITGIFGMNFARMPWLQEPNGFWWSIGLMGSVVVAISGVWALGRWLDR